MIIHVVRPGETLNAIAHAYGVSISAIAAVSQPPNLNRLVPGQTLLIPIRPAAQLPAAEMNAYLEPKGTADDTALIRSAGDSLTYLSVFSYQVQSDGSFISPNDEIAIREALRNRIAPLLVISNFSDGRFHSDIARTILRDSAKQNQLIGSLLSTMRTKGYRGINVDFEYVYPDDREAYNQFLRNLAARVRPEGFSVSSALAPKRSASQKGLLYEAHDYAAHGQIVDFSVLMTYEYGWSGGPPMAVAPPSQVRQVLAYATSVMPHGKIMMGMPLYGYDWTLPYVYGGPWARQLGIQDAYTVAIQAGSPIVYDQPSDSPYFHYSVSGKTHVVWFEDARSMDKKFQLIKEFRLRGGSYWELALPFPQNWALLKSTFRITKLL
jgi:spore germination protein